MKRLDAPPVILAAVDRCFDELHSNPEFLLRQPIGLPRVEADACIAWIYGHDDQVEAEWRVTLPPQPVLLRPLPSPASYSLADDPLAEPPRHAEYELMNGWATVTLHADQDITNWFGSAPSTATFRHRLLCVRYERRMP